jgi:hypothetical protein
MKYTLTIVSFFFLANTSAQTKADPSGKQFGFEAGINITNMNFNLGEPAPAVHEKPAWKTDLSFGFLIRIPLAKRLLLQPEYFFSQRKSADNSLQTNYTFNYLSLPVLLNFQLLPWISLIAGPQIEILLNAQSENLGVAKNITHDVEERSIGINGGFEIEITGPFFLYAGYLQGLNHIGIGQRFDVKEFKYQSFMLTGGVRF